MEFGRAECFFAIEWMEAYVAVANSSVMKSSEHRDQIAKEHNIIAFEMEGAGV